MRGAAGAAFEWEFGWEQFVEGFVVEGGGGAFDAAEHVAVGESGGGLEEGIELVEVDGQVDGAVGGEALEDAALVEDFGFDEGACEVEAEGFVEAAAVLFEAGAGRGGGGWAEQALDAARPGDEGNGDVQFGEGAKGGGGGLGGGGDDDALNFDEGQGALGGWLAVGPWRFDQEGSAGEADGCAWCCDVEAWHQVERWR